MYIQKLTLHNIRSIGHFDMHFPEPAGWHVLIGDNGAGKSTIVRSAALVMLDVDDINGARQNWNDWLSQQATTGSIEAVVQPDESFDGAADPVESRITFARENEGLQTPALLSQVVFRGRPSYFRNAPSGAPEYRTYSSFLSANNPVPGSLSSGYPAWFSAAYGPYRRFSGGSPEFESVFRSNPRLGMHLSVFSEGVALTEALTFLRDTYARELETKVHRSSGTSVTDPTIPQTSVIGDLKTFVNEAGLLPHGTTIDRVELSGVYFRDANGNHITTLQLSDGYRSMLSLIFELIQQLIRAYGPDTVFANVRAGLMHIDVPGVVMIDEIDTHLHPTWQTRIGDWFLRCFPRIQFIVTTHSPLICRACERGSIWRLAAPGSPEPSGEVTGQERDRLIYGTVLDAFGTEIFGNEVSQSERGQAMGARVAHLNMKSFKGTISESERQELYALRAKMPTVE